MSTRRWSAWAAVVLLNAGLLGVLGFYQTSGAQPQQRNLQPFANSVEQRDQMIAELRTISALLKEQNALLRSGKLKVVVGGN